VTANAGNSSNADDIVAAAEGLQNLNVKPPGALRQHRLLACDAIKSAHLSSAMHARMASAQQAGPPVRS
jgi:hypothetical protein